MSLPSFTGQLELPTPMQASRIYFKITVYKVDECINLFFLGKGNKWQDELLFNNTDVSQYLILWFLNKWRNTISHPSEVRCGHVTSFWPMGCEWKWHVSLQVEAFNCRCSTLQPFFASSRANFIDLGWGGSCLRWWSFYQSTSLGPWGTMMSWAPAGPLRASVKKKSVFCICHPGKI